MAIYDGMAIQPSDVRYGNIAFAVAGQIVDLYFHEIVSASVTEEITFGSVVSQNADGTVSLGGTFFGIAVRELAREMDVRGVAAVTKYVLGNTAGVMRKGHIYVTLAGATAAAIGGAVYTDGSGAITAVVSDTAIAGATFESAGVTGDIVQIRLA